MLLKNGCFYTALSSISILRNGDFYVGSTLTAIFPYTHPDTNRAAEVLAFILNGRYSGTSGRRERAPSRTDWISKDSQKGADSSGKAVSTD